MSATQSASNSHVKFLITFPIQYIFMAFLGLWMYPQLSKETLDYIILMAQGNLWIGSLNRLWNGTGSNPVETPLSLPFLLLISTSLTEAG